MPEFDFWLLVVAIPVVLFAGWIHGALGLGFPLIATPLIAIFIDVKAAILITLLPTASVNIASVMTAQNVIATAGKYRLLMLATFMGGIVGSVLLAHTDPSPYRLMLAFFIVVFLLTDHFDFRLNIQPVVSMMLLFGCLAGFAGGTTNVMVAVLIIYFLSVNVARSEMVPAMNLCFLVGKSTQIFVFLILGVVSFKWLLYTIPLALISVASLKVGQHFGERIPADRYRGILKVALLLLAAILIAQFFLQAK